MAIKTLKNSKGSITSNNTGHYWGTTTTNTTLGVSPITTTTGGLFYNNTSTLDLGDGISINSDIIEYIDIFYQFMGIDMDYKRFSAMSKEEKKGFLRDLKLQKLIDEK